MELKTREEAIELWRKHNTDEALYRHALSVEAVMKHFAEKYKEDVHYWSLVGLLHDIDYGEHPNEHLMVAPKILSELGYDENFIRAVLSHGYTICSDVEPLHIMEKVLFAVDELTGFITACAIMRPSKSILDIEVKSVRKKFASPAFAAKVRRDIIEKGAAMLNLSLDELIKETILAMRIVAKEISLVGNIEEK